MKPISARKLDDRRDEPINAVQVFLYADGQIIIDDGMTCEFTCGDDPKTISMTDSWKAVRAMLELTLDEVRPLAEEE